MIDVFGLTHDRHNWLDLYEKWGTEFAWTQRGTSDLSLIGFLLKVSSGLLTFLTFCCYIFFNFLPHFFLFSLTFFFIFSHIFFYFLPHFIFSPIFFLPHFLSPPFFSPTFLFNFLPHFICFLSATTKYGYLIFHLINSNNRFHFYCL